jgi:anti-sigma regulatory factor (Ser/Thr protein kinase)
VGLGAGIFSAIESTLSLPPDPASPSLARRFVRQVLAEWGADEFEEPATLLTSELVTNAVLHARSSAQITLRLADGRLWVGVADGVEVSPVRKRYGPEAATGRGLLLIERMAAAWGTERSGPGNPGKVVWFELAAEAGGGPDVALAADAVADLADLADLGGHDRPNAGGPGHRRGFRAPRTRTRRPYPPQLRRGARR